MDLSWPKEWKWWAPADVHLKKKKRRGKKKKARTGNDSSNLTHKILVCEDIATTTTTAVVDLDGENEAEDQTYILPVKTVVFLEGETRAEN